MRRTRSTIIEVILLLIIFVASCLATYITFKPKESKKITDSTLLINEFKHIEHLNVLAVDYSLVLDSVVKRQFLPDFHVSYKAHGTLLYGVDLSQADFTFTPNVTITTPMPYLTSYNIDQAESGFINPEWRFGVNEFELAGEMIKLAESKVKEYAYSDSLIAEACVATEIAIKDIACKVSKEVEIKFKFP